MLHLYDSRGRHILNEHDGYLCLNNGKIIGRYFQDRGVFADLNGKYIGEIYCMNRIVYDRTSRYRHMSFPPTSAGGSIGVHLSPHSYCPIELPPEMSDIDLDQLMAAS